MAQFPPLACNKFAGHGVDMKIAQELLRYANSRTTLGIYTRAVLQQKWHASAK